MIETKKRIFTLFLLMGLPFFLNARSTHQTRALWVTRWDYHTADDLRQVIKNAAQLNFNVLLLQVRGNGTVFYPSKLEPWAEEFGMQDPGWDPLQLAIDLGRAENIKIHAWINVYPAWRGTKTPGAPRQLFLDHRDWIVTDVFGRRQQLNHHYVWLSPTHPQVKEYLLDVCAELYENYRIDGLHLDYIRYPGNMYSYDSTSVALFTGKYGAPPRQKPRQWAIWRRDAITDFLSDLSRNINVYDPGLVLSASVLGDYGHGYRVYLQDSHAWLARGVVDAVFPMIYSGNNILFETHLLEHIRNDHGRHIYPGLYARNAGQLKEQMDIVMRNHCKGLSVFSYGLLFKNHRPAPEFDNGVFFPWPGKAELCQFSWKNTPHDIQGPAIIQVKTVPENLFTDTKFKIAAQIFDPSGVFDDDSGPEGQGVYLKYGAKVPSSDGQTVHMSRIHNSDNWFITDQAIAPHKHGLDFMCRIFAWDNYHRAANVPARNVGYSDIWSLSVFLPNITYVSAGYFGPVLSTPTGIAVDQRGQVWVASLSDTAVHIFDKNGAEMAFSPIMYGIDQQNRPLTLQKPAGMSFCPPHSMYITANQNPTRIFRFNTVTGKALPALELDFHVDEMACDEKGHLFLLDNKNLCWRILSKEGLNLQGSPFKLEHPANDIAVIDNAELVFLSDRIGQTVQCWRGGIKDLTADYFHAAKFNAVDIGFGKVAVDRADHLYVAHSRRGVITIFDKYGEPLQYLSGGLPILNAPAEIGVTGTGRTIYVLESVGIGPSRITKWVKKRKN